MTDEPMARVAESDEYRPGEPLGVGRERARRIVTARLLADGMGDEKLAATAVQRSLDTLDLTWLRELLPTIPARGGVRGVSALEAAEYLERNDPMQLEDLLDRAARRGELLRIEHGPVVRYALPEALQP